MSENMRVLVTIAIPTFNRADGNLICALQSAISQTYKNIEIIVSDNCSSDDTEQVVKQFKDPRLQYVRHPENIGANANFNFCLSQAKGDYFLLLHDDDLIDDDFVSVCMKAENYVFNDIGIIRTGTRWIDVDGNVLSEKPILVGACSTEGVSNRGPASHPSSEKSPTVGGGPYHPNSNGLFAAVQSRAQSG